jgi:hypothetical protein
MINEEITLINKRFPALSNANSDVSFEIHHKSNNFFKLKDYEFDIKKIFY